MKLADPRSLLIFNVQLSTEILFLSHNNLSNLPKENFTTLKNNYINFKIYIEKEIHNNKQNSFINLNYVKETIYENFKKIDTILNYYSLKNNLNNKNTISKKIKI